MRRADLRALADKLLAERVGRVRSHPRSYLKSASVAVALTFSAGVGGCSAAGDSPLHSEPMKGSIGIDSSSRLEDELGGWSFGPAEVAGGRVESAVRLGMTANPRFPSEAWARLKPPKGSWALAGRIGVSDVPPAPSVVLFLEIVSDGDVVLWRGSIRPGKLLDIPAVEFPSGKSIELHAGFESNRVLTFLVFSDLRFQPA